MLVKWKDNNIQDTFNIILYITILNIFLLIIFMHY